MNHPAAGAGIGPAMAGEGGRMSEVYAVVYSNYEPSEVAAIYSNRAAAEADRDARGGSWEVERWVVRDRYEKEES